MSAEPASPSDGLPPLLDLPEPVRGRVVAVTARVLPDIVRVPAALRKVAAFAPARRARHGSRAIQASLAADEEFREHVGILVAALPEDGGAADRAARLWLVRPDGAAEALNNALTELTSLSVVEVATNAQVEALSGHLQAPKGLAAQII